jgi:phosphoribosylglycinamide formyltransferase 1
VAGRFSLGVLVSGEGTNLQALLDASRDPAYPAEVALVVSNVPGARALARAEAAGVTALALDHKTFASREAFDHAMGDALAARGVDLVVSAGFMRLLTPGFLSRFEGRVINLHPSLLPAFPGVRAIEQALAYGVRVTGCTVHFVDTGTDTGPIIAQAVVRVAQDDDAASLAAKIHREEHRLLTEVVALLARGKARVEGRRVLIVGNGE